jgi:quercetin dioxygenase-like cupin family protein
VPEGAGWFVVNAREARWWHHDTFGSAVVFEGDPGFSQFGINIQVLQPGEPNCMYHGESGQEDFLVLSGEYLLLIQGEERLLKQWDFVHSPPWTEHVFAGRDRPSVILMVGVVGERGAALSGLGGRAEAQRRVDKETASGREAYVVLESKEVTRTPCRT